MLSQCLASLYLSKQMVKAKIFHPSLQTMILLFKDKPSFPFSFIYFRKESISKFRRRWRHEKGMLSQVLSCHWFFMYSDLCDGGVLQTIVVFHLRRVHSAQTTQTKAGFSFSDSRRLHTIFSTQLQLLSLIFVK